MAIASFGCMPNASHNAHVHTAMIDGVEQQFTQPPVSAPSALGHLRIYF